MIIVYGIPNCNTVKKARKWLESAGIDYTFHDYKKSGVDDARITHYAEIFGWDRVINRQGTSWRTLSDAEKASTSNPAAALAAVKRNPSLIKRPIVDTGSAQLIGFDEAEYQRTLGQ